MIRHAGITVDVRRKTIRYGTKWARLESRTIAMVARALLCQSGGWVSNRELIHIVWGAYSDGGPLAANKTVAGYVWRVANALRVVGAPVEISTMNGRGYMLAFHEAQRHAA